MQEHQLLLSGSLPWTCFYMKATPACMMRPAHVSLHARSLTQHCICLACTTPARFLFARALSATCDPPQLKPSSDTAKLPNNLYYKIPVYSGMFIMVKFQLISIDIRKLLMINKQQRHNTHSHQQLKVMMS